MKQIANHQREKEPNVAGQLIFRYLPYWPIFVILLGIAGAAAWFYLRYTTPLYEANSTIYIKDEKKGAEDAKAIEELNVLSSKKIIENEVEVIQAKSLLNDVVKKLTLYAPVYEEGKIRTASAFTRSPVRIRSDNPDLIRNTDKIYFSLTPKSEVAFDNIIYPLNQWVNTRYGKLWFEKNPYYDGTQTKQLYFQLVDPRQVSGLIKSRLKVNPSSKQSSVLNLNVKDEVPVRASEILNELMASYAASQESEKDSLAASTLTFVEARLKEVESDLRSMESRNQQYKANTSAVDISTQGQLFLQNVSANDQKLSEINMQSAMLDQVENYVQSKHSAGSIVPSTMGNADPMLPQLLEKLYTTELEYQKLRTTTAENNPMALTLNEQINKIRPSILENIQNQRRSLQASKRSVSAANTSYAAILQSLPEKERQLIDINREQNTKNGIYAFLSQKREETALTKASRVSASRVIEDAEYSPFPVNPKPKVIYLSALLIAMFLGIGLVTAKESLSRTVMFRHQIENLTSQPVIGEIASGSKKTPVVIGEDKKTFVAEQFRKLRTTLKFVGVDANHKRIMVTSAISGEGKSFVSLNLAISLALTGKKVVLIDCDLNNPSLNKKLEIEDEIGVSEYLSDEATKEDIVKRTHLDENLYFIPTGRLPRNPSELIMNGKMEGLLNQLNEDFDYIILDTAPVSPVTDAYILSPFCDATLFVVRHKYTPKVFLERLDEENKINQLKNIAIVFNGVQSRGFGSRKYGYGYGYGYIYDGADNRRSRMKLFN